MSSNDHTGIKVENLSVKLGNVSILEDVNIQFECSKITAVIGPNGAGKTTLLHAILGLVPYSGKVFLCPQTEFEKQGKPVIGYLPQNLQFDRNLPVTVLDFLCSQFQRRPLWLGYTRSIRQAVRRYLEDLNVWQLKDRLLGKLSGGELQRVLLASSLVRNPHIVLMDEPGSGIDMAGEEIFHDLLIRKQKKNKFTLVIVSHELSVVSRYADYVVCLNKTVKCHGKAIEVLTGETLQELYGHPVSIYKHNLCDVNHGEGK